MIIYLLDTDSLIFWLKGNLKIEEQALKIGLTALGYSTISHAELWFGAHNSQRVAENLQAIKKIQHKLQILHFNTEAAEQFGIIKSNLKQRGNIIMDADLMIASIALANNLVLVTNNLSHFNRIENLKIESWLK